MSQEQELIAAVRSHVASTDNEKLKSDLELLYQTALGCDDMDAWNAETRSGVYESLRTVIRLNDVLFSVVKS